MFLLHPCQLSLVFTLSPALPLTVLFSSEYEDLPQYEAVTQFVSIAMEFTVQLQVDADAAMASPDFGIDDVTMALRLESTARSPSTNENPVATFAHYVPFADVTMLPVANPVTGCSNIAVTLKVTAVPALASDVPFTSLSLPVPDGPCAVTWAPVGNSFVDAAASVMLVLPNQLLSVVSTTFTFPDGTTQTVPGNNCSVVSLVLFGGALGGPVLVAYQLSPAALSITDLHMGTVALDVVVASDIGSSGACCLLFGCLLFVACCSFLVAVTVSRDLVALGAFCARLGGCGGGRLSYRGALLFFVVLVSRFVPCGELPLAVTVAAHPIGEADSASGWTVLAACLWPGCCSLPGRRFVQ